MHRQRGAQPSRDARHAASGFGSTSEFGQKTTLPHIGLSLPDAPPRPAVSSNRRFGVRQLDAALAVLRALRVSLRRVFLERKEEKAQRGGAEERRGRRDKRTANEGSGISKCEGEASFRTPSYFSSAGTCFSEAELMQKRRPVGRGPSSKTCPRWASHFAQRTSVRIMPCVASLCISTLSASWG